MKNKAVSVSLFLDKRRAKKDNTFPVKLRMYHLKTQKLYSVNLNCTAEAFRSAYKLKKTKSEFFELKVSLSAIERKAEDVIDGLEVFTWSAFESKMFLASSDFKDVFEFYERYETQLKEDGRILTAESYRASRGSLTRFLKSQNNRNEKLLFQDITVDFLKKYEKWMIINKNSLTTVGFYLRPLRAIFNTAISEEVITKDLYPFGKRLYQIPSGQNVKRALNAEDLKKLLNHPVVSPLQEKARDFWFFSYNCNGINTRDIVELKFKNLAGELICFNRSKTINTNRTNQKPIVVNINDFMKSFMEKYANKDKSSENYLFPIINQSMNKEEQVQAARSFTRFLNQHIKEIAREAGITTELSTYWARHSFTTMAMRNGNSLEMLQEALGHTDMKTTMNYWSGFDNSAKKELSDKLMNF
jgi:integrase/recombinase XerD